MVKLSRTLVAFSKDLRTKQTPSELVLWKHLRANNFEVKFKRQVIIGPYIFDFGAKRKKILIELDGFGHKGEGRAKDKQKIDYAKSLGYTVLKFWNNDIEKNLSQVLYKIESVLKL